PRNEASRRQAGDRHDVHRRRPGGRGALRGDLSPPFDIAVVGCGTAGAAAALFLARAGHPGTGCERVPDPGPVRAGIVLQPTGQHVLARLGLLGPIVAKGARLDGLQVTTTEGRVVVDLEYRMVDARYFGLGLHRGVLFKTLFDAVRAESRI